MPWVEDDSPPKKGWSVDEAPGQPASDKRRGDKGIMRKIDAGVRGAADMLTFGFADELAAAGDTAFNGKPYSENLASQRAIDNADADQVPVSRGVGQGAGFVAGIGTGAVVNAGRVLPNALRTGGGLAGRLGRAAVAGTAVGGVSGAGAADGDVGERARAAVMPAIAGGAVGLASVPLAAGVGAGFNALTRRGAPPIERAANALRPRTNVQEATGRANALRANGAVPSFVSATDQAGRGYVAAAANRMTPGREIVQQRAEAAALDLPNRISGQARTHLSADPRTPAEIADELGQARRTQGNADFGAVRGERVPLSDDAVQALRTDDGRGAIREAAAASLRSLDPEERAIGAELNRLAGEALDNPGGVEISVGQSQAISEALLDAADVAARAGSNRKAGSLGALGRAIRDNARARVGGYDDALNNFAAQSRVMEAAEQGEDFLARNTDEFIANTPGPGQPGNDVARATARRAVERKAGENVSSAPGVARALATAPEQMARNRALLGEQGAAALEGGMAAEARVVRDLADVAPRNGSKTALTTADQETVANAAEVGQAIQQNGIDPLKWVGTALGNLKKLGLSDADAEVVANIATDPAQLDDLLRRIARQPGGAQFVEPIRRALANAGEREAGVRTAPQPAIEVTAPASPGAVGRAY